MVLPPRVLDTNVLGRLRLGPRGELDVFASIAALEAAHSDDLAAGAALVRTATGALSRWRMNREGQWDRFAAANTACCRAAMDARDSVNPEALVAGTLWPVREVYEPLSTPDGAVIEMEVAEQALLMEPLVDLFIAERLSSVREAVATIHAAASTGRPVWVGLAVSLDEPTALEGGEPVAEAVAAIAAAGPDAILVNARTADSAGPAVEALMRAAVPRADLLRGVVADAFDRWPNGAVEEHTPRAFVQYARRWMEFGVHLMAADQGASAEHVAALRGLIATEWK